jgi:hypothetical protein
MNRNINTIAICILLSAIVSIIGYKAFVWGFEHGAYQLPTQTQTQAVGTQNGW